MGKAIVRIAQASGEMFIGTVFWSVILSLVFGSIAFASNGFRGIGNERFSEIFGSSLLLAVFCAGVHLKLLVEPEDS
jgi:hypothetical protein